jgi:5-methylcytosine-specific restriction enzyme subunit McrC
MARTPGMNSDLASAARGTALRMTGVTLIEPDVRRLGRVHIHRNNRFYGFLLSICRLIMEATSVKESGDTLAEMNQRFYRAVEERLPALFEAFVRNFYRTHLTAHGFSRFDAQHIEWLWNPMTEDSRSYLPKMITDITLEHPDRKIILDTKFYQSGGINDRQTFESANLYQLHAYVSQLARHAQRGQANSNSRPHPHDDRAEGILLYATVGENNYTHRFAMPPHHITVATVDLNLPWQDVEQRLLELILTQPSS